MTVSIILHVGQIKLVPTVPVGHQCLVTPLDDGACEAKLGGGIIWGICPTKNRQCNFQHVKSPVRERSGGLLCGGNFQHFVLVP
jgi:hypothetical protein